MPNLAILTTFIIYLIVLLIIGYVAYQRTQNLSDYILGGRQLGKWVTALSAGASDMSGWLLLGLPGAIYAGGLSEAWIALGLFVGAWLNWKITAPRLRAFTEHYHSLTLPDYFSQRFQDKRQLLRIVSASIILIFFTVYVASGLTAGAKLFEAAFQLDYRLALFVGGLVIIAYTFTGGFLAVSWTDLVQGLLMATALIIVPVTMLIYLDGYTSSVQSIALADHSAQTFKADWFGDHSALEYFSSISFISLMAWGFGYFGQPHLLARFMAAKSVKEVHSARRIAMSWMAICIVGALAVGFFGIAYFAQSPYSDALTKDSEQVFIIASKVLFHPWVSGFLLAAILAAVMSTIDSQLLVTSSALTQDFYHSLINKQASEKTLMMVSRASVLLVAGVALIIALDRHSKVLALVANAWAGFGSAFGPVILISLLWKRMTLWGALSGMLSGALTVILWIQLKKLPNFPLNDLYEMIPGVLIASISIFLVSLYGPQNHVKIQQQYEQAEKKI